MTSESSDPEGETARAVEPHDADEQREPDRLVAPLAAQSAPIGPYTETAAAQPAPMPALPAPPRRRPLRRLLSTLAFVGALVLVGYVVYSGVQNLVGGNLFHERIAETEAEIEQLRIQASQLAALIAYLDSDAYIERTAREDLGMVRPGEEAFAVHASARSSLEIRRSPWWANLLPDSATEQFSLFLEDDSGLSAAQPIGAGPGE